MPRRSAGPQFGMGLDGLANARDGVLHGIVNGIDVDVWNTETDAHLKKTFGPGRRSFEAPTAQRSRRGSASTRGTARSSA